MIDTNEKGQSAQTPQPLQNKTPRTDSNLKAGAPTKHCIMFVVSHERISWLAAASLIRRLGLINA